MTSNTAIKPEPTRDEIKAAILALEPIQVLKVYSGRANANGNHCRCGCRGKYSYNPLLASVFVGSNAERGYALDAEDISLTAVKGVIAKMKKAAETCDAGISMADGWLDVELPSGRSYTAYLVSAS